MASSRPTAALSSFPYAPEQAMRALRHFYDVLGDRIWGRFGFTDAFSETHDWYASTYLAIDQGPIVIMIENYRTGLLWKLFMSDPDVQDRAGAAWLFKPAWELGGKPMATAGATTGGVPGDEKSLLLDWMARQNDVSTASMLRAISAAHLVKERRGFGQTIRPARGSVLASPALGSWDPDPDYFFHWLRDLALVIDALRHVIAEGAFAGEGLSRFKEFVAFSLSLNRLDGAGFLRLAGDFRKNIDPFYLQYVRDDNELCAIAGDRVLGEPRFNPDGTLDISKWSRPQHDGPALRALALMRFWPLDGLDGQARASMRALILTDLEFIVRHWRESCFDIWEEELGHHYYTRLVHHAALADGAQWLEETGTDEAARTQACLAAAQAIAQSLDEYWSPTKAFTQAAAVSRTGWPERNSISRRFRGDPRRAR